MTKTKKKKDFEHQMMDTGRTPNLLAAGIILVYTFYFSGTNILQEGPVQIVKAGVIVLFLVTLGQFILAPQTNRWLTKKISQALEKEESGNLTVDERTDLVKALTKCPLYICREVAIVFTIIASMLSLSYHFVFTLDKVNTFFIFAGAVFGSYNAGILAYYYAEGLCNKYASILLNREINKESIKEKKYYGEGIFIRIFRFVIVPVIMASILQMLFIFKGHVQNIEARRHVIDLIVLCVINAGVILTQAIFLFKGIVDAPKEISLILEKLITGKLDAETKLPLSLTNELSSNLYMVNEIINSQQSISNDAFTTSIGIINSTQELSRASKKSAEISIKQATSVRECLSTMDDVQETLKNISKRITDVSYTADVTRDNVNAGFDLLGENISKMSEITEANIETITGIKDLSEKIDDVWDIISTIDSIAAKTRIIAFNAELEATAAGENGENLHIVANEVRRLADSITNSTREIKDGIKKIQESSDNLIITSEGGTQKIREGSEFFADMEERFTELRTTSDITSESAAAIQNIIATQNVSFKQINSTLHQISTGFDHFSESAQLINDASEKLRLVSEQLSTIKHLSREEV